MYRAVPSPGLTGPTLLQRPRSPCSSPPHPSIQAPHMATKMGTEGQRVPARWTLHEPTEVREARGKTFQNESLHSVESGGPTWLSWFSRSLLPTPRNSPVFQSHVPAWALGSRGKGDQGASFCQLALIQVTSLHVSKCLSKAPTVKTAKTQYKINKTSNTKQT